MSSGDVYPLLPPTKTKEKENRKLPDWGNGGEGGGLGWFRNLVPGFCSFSSEVRAPEMVRMVEKVRPLESVLK